MDKELQKKVDKLVKSLQKNVKKVTKKDAIADVLDSNSVAEMSPDSIAPDRTGVVKKSKKEDEEECECQQKNECECDEAPTEKIDMHKSEELIRNLTKNFELIAQAYIIKKEETRMANEQEQQQLRDKKQSNELWHKWKNQAKKFYEKNKEATNEKPEDNQDLAASEHIKE